MAFGLSFFLLAPSGISQQPPAAKPADAAKPDIKAGVEEVVLDLVIRDKKGKELRDLEPADIQVFDNNKKVDIRSMRLVEGREAIEKGAKVQLDPLRQIRLVSIVFRPLGLEGRRLAKSAALDLIKDQAQNVFYSVIFLNQQVNLLQDFTTDREKLKKAIEDATSGGQNLKFAAQSNAVRDQLQRQLGPSTSGQTLAEQAAVAAHPPGDVPSGQNAAASAGNLGAGIVNARMAEVLLRMLETSQTVGAGEDFRATLNGLTAIVRGDALLPGRKSVMFFSEGLYVPKELDQEWEALFGEANRANVSFYPIDARGLQIASDQAGARGDLSAAASDSATTITRTEGAVTQGEIMAAEKGENASRNNIQNSLFVLASATGGFAVANTNDFRNPLRRINEEINTYYEVTYNPGIDNYDASFRKIRVDVGRPDVKVQARSGYYALPPNAAVGGAATVSPFEMPLLGALQANPMPKDLDFRSAALHLAPARTGDGGAAVLLEVPLKNIKFNIDAAKKTYSGHFSSLMLLKNDQGTVVKKWSRDVPTQGAADKLQAVQSGFFTFKDQFSVPPGRYTLEAAVMDREGNKLGGRKSAFVVPAQVKGVAMSNIDLVRRYEPNAQGLDPADPFQFQGGRITPTLTTNVAGGKGAMLTMFFIVYPDPAIAAKPEITLEYIKDGMVVGKGQIPLPAADVQGRIPYVMSSSAEAMPQGTYEIHATVTQGGTSAEERAFITVE